MTFEIPPDRSEFEFVPDQLGSEYEPAEPGDTTDHTARYNYSDEPGDAGCGMIAQNRADGSGDADDNRIDDDTIRRFLEHEARFADNQPPGPPIDRNPPIGPGFPEDGEGDGSSAELADRLLDVLAGDPPTIEEQDDVRMHYEAVRWLGTENVPSPLLRAFAMTDTALGTIGEVEAIRLVERHLDQFDECLDEVDRGIWATKVLTELTARYAERGIIEHEQMSTYGLDQEGLYLGQFVLVAFGTLVDLYERPYLPDAPYARLLRHDCPDGSTHLVHPGSRGRYNIGYTADGPKVTRETLHTLQPADLAFIRGLHRQLTNHRQVLLGVAESAGFDARALIRPDAPGPEFAQQLQRVSRAVSDVGFQLELPEDVRRGLTVSTTGIWQTIKRSPRYSNYSQQEDEYGLHATGMRMRAYFDALIRERPEY